MQDKAAISSAKKTLVEEGTEFKGTMTSTCPVTVNGRIEGELSAPRLDVTSSGVVVGKIKAERLTSRGQLSGEIDAGDLSLSGSVGSNTVIRAKNLEVKLAPSSGRMQVTFGECTLDVGDEPTRSIAPQPAKGAEASDDAAKRGSKPPLDPGPDPKPVEASSNSVPPPTPATGDNNALEAEGKALPKAAAGDEKGGDNKGGKSKGAKGGSPNP